MRVKLINILRGKEGKDSNAKLNRDRLRFIYIKD